MPRRGSRQFVSFGAPPGLSPVIVTGSRRAPRTAAASLAVELPRPPSCACPFDVAIVHAVANGWARVVFMGSPRTPRSASGRQAPREVASTLVVARDSSHARRPRARRRPAPGAMQEPVLPHAGCWSREWSRARAGWPKLPATPGVVQSSCPTPTAPQSTYRPKRNRGRPIPCAAAELVSGWRWPAGLEVLMGMSSAHLLFAARLRDRTRAQDALRWGWRRRPRPRAPRLRGNGRGCGRRSLRRVARSLVRSLRDVAAMTCGVAGRGRRPRRCCRPGRGRTHPGW